MAEERARMGIPSHLDDGAWFHGSPEELTLLATGSTITRCRVVAEAFSHKPFCLGLDEDRSPIPVCHNGRLGGFLYVVDELVGEQDVRPHPRSAFAEGALEWLTERPLQVRKVATLPIGDPPCLGEACPRRRSRG